MNENERIERLTAVLRDTGSSVINAFRIDAFDSKLADHHIAQIAEWADLEFLLASRTLITSACVDNVCRFRNLKCLSIGGNAITCTSLAHCDFPPTIEDLCLSSISLSDEAIENVCRCIQLVMLNVNHCGISHHALERLSSLPNLEVIEALGADSTRDTVKQLSELYPRVLFRVREGLWRDGHCRRHPFPNDKP